MGKWLMLGTLLAGGVAVVVCIVVVIASLGDSDAMTTAGSVIVWSLGVWTAVYLVVSVVVVVDAIRMARRRDLATLRRSTVVVKFGNIPFFVCNYVLLSFIATALVPVHGVGLLLAPFLVVWTYLVMLPTSAYGLACVSVLRRADGATRSTAVAHRLMHLAFVLDVVSTFVVAQRARQLLAADERARRAGVPALP